MANTNNDVPLINGRAYDFAMVTLAVGGYTVNSCSEVNYEEQQDKVNNFGKGSRPVSRGRKTIKPKASVTFSMNDTEQLRKICKNLGGNGSMLQLPMFDVVITFLNDAAVVTHTLKNAEFTTDGTDTKLDDTDIKVKYELVLSDIVYS